MMPRIRHTSDLHVIEVRFSDAPVKHEFTGDVIADVNPMGNWVRGLELLGSGIQFSLERAISSLRPQSYSRHEPYAHDKLTVTYDEDANAGFLHLPYASPTMIEQEQQKASLLLKSSRTVEDEAAVFGLASDKTLVFIRFRLPAAENPRKFSELFVSDTDSANPGCRSATPPGV